MGFEGFTNSKCVEGLLNRELTGSGHVLSKEKKKVKGESAPFKF